MPQILKKTEVALVCILLSVYFFLAINRIILPGLHDDEAMPACPAVDFLKGKVSHYSSGLTFLGRRIPLMSQVQDAGAASYFLLPFFQFFKINVFSLRLASVFFGILTLLFTYLFSRRVFDRNVAILSTFLLATSPYFISATRVGGKYRSYTAFFAISSIYYLFRWYKERRPIHYWLGAFLLGVGCSASWWFNAYLASLLFLAFIYRKEIKISMQSGSAKALFLIASGAALFCLGDLLFIYANFINSRTRFLTFRVMFKDFPYAAFGVHKLNNLDFITNFSTRLINLLQLIRESDIMTRHIIEVKSNFLYPFLVLTAVSWLIFLFISDKAGKTKRKKIAFLLILASIAVLMSSVYGITEFGSYQLLFLVPFIHLIAALGLLEFIRFFRIPIIRKISLGAVCLCLSLSTVINLNMLRIYFKEMQRTGGHGSWPGAIYELADWLEKNNASNSVAFGYAHSLYFLTEGGVYSHDFGILEHQNELTGLLHDPNALYIFDNERLDLKPHIASIYKIADSMGKGFVKKKEFLRAESAPIEVYVLE